MMSASSRMTRRAWKRIGAEGNGKWKSGQWKVDIGQWDLPLWSRRSSVGQEESGTLMRGAGVPIHRWVVRLASRVSVLLGARLAAAILARPSRPRRAPRLSAESVVRQTAHLNFSESTPGGVSFVVCVGGAAHRQRSTGHYRM